MVDSDMSLSETSSTASDALLIISSAPKADRSRFERCYSRSALLQLSKSDKVCAPKGLKHLSEWYGEYEPPSVHPGNGNAHGGPNGPGGARYYATKERSHRTGGQNERGNERYNDRDRESRDINNANAGSSASAARSSSASATGAMGDFKLAGSKPFSKDIDSNDALSGGRPRRLNGRDSDFSSKGIEGRELRPWSATGANASTDVDRRRQVGGDFVKKDGRAAEEGGWRTAKELERMSRNRERDGVRPSPLDRDRDLRGLGDRRRQPAWMDEDEPSSGGSKASPSGSTFQRRGQNGFDSTPSSGGGMPAWMADGAPKDSNTLDDSLEALEARHGTTLAAPGKAQHVDSIQAWKAEMKALEQKKKREEQRALRREMGLPDLPDTDEVTSSKATKLEDTPAASASEPLAPAPPPAKSVFSDFLLPSASKDKEAPKAEEKPRSSRFAKMFVAGAAEPANSQSQRPSSSSSTPTSQQPANQLNSANTGANSLLAALMPGAGSGTMIRDGSSPKPPPSQADSQSMARLMEMLHMASTPSQDGHPTSSPAGQQHRPPSPPRNDAAQLSQPDRRPRQQQPGGAQALSVPLSQQQHQQHAQHGTSSPYDQQIQSPPRSRLGNRTSSQAGMSRSAADPAQMGQGVQRPESNAAQHPQMPQYQQQGISPPPPANINLLHLLSAQMPQQPPGPPNDSFLNHQQQQHNLRQQRPQQPVQSPPPAPQGRQHQSAASPADQQAHLAAFMQAQATAGRLPTGASHGPLGSNMPHPQQSGLQQQYGRPSSQGPPLLQQHSHPSHMRSPSGSMNPASLMQQQQQQHHQSNGASSPFNGPPGSVPGNHPLPPHANPNFAQQNALAQLLAQGATGGVGRGLPGPGQGEGQGPAGFGMLPPQSMQHGGIGPDPRFQARGPPDQPPWAYQQHHQHQPLPPHHQQSNMHHAPSPQMQMQQNQIDIMALLTGGRK